jgi:hypothetical protein
MTDTWLGNSERTTSVPVAGAAASSANPWTHLGAGLGSARPGVDKLPIVLVAANNVPCSKGSTPVEAYLHKNARRRTPLRRP